MKLQFLAIAVSLVLFSGTSDAQTQASCTFKVFLLNPANPLNPITYPSGVTDKGTVVGGAIPLTTGEVAFTRYSDGSIRYYTAPGSADTAFTARNVNAISIGTYDTNNPPIAYGFVLNGKVFTPIAHAGSTFTYAAGINKWNTIVGSYMSSDTNFHGFIRQSDGSLVDLDYPGEQSTDPRGINDDGVIVGNYANTTTNTYAGFVYYKGKWASVNYPGTVGTTLVGISNAGVVIGTTVDGASFLYKNGAFKLIAIPSFSYTEVQGISPDGLITGFAFVGDDNGDQHGFTARCK
jgi:hypothetical protein